MKQSGPPKILFLTLYDEKGASSRHCVYNFLTDFSMANLPYEVRPLLTKNVYQLIETLAENTRILTTIATLTKLAFTFLRRYKDVWDSRRFELVAVQKDVLPFGAQFLLSIRARNIVFLVDDPIWIKNPSVLGNFPILSSFITYYRKALVKSLCKKSSLVLVENPKMQEDLIHFCKNTVVLPSSIPFQSYSVKTESNPQSVCLGWIGSPGTLYLLKALLPCLEELAKDFSFTFYNVSSTQMESEKFKIENLPWTEANELLALNKMDIGLMPMDTTLFSSYRTSRKWLIYSAAKIMTFAQVTPLNQELMRDGENVVFYSSEKEFKEKMANLLRDSKFRDQIAAQAYQDVRTLYDHPVVATRFVDLIQEQLAPKFN